MHFKGEILPIDDSNQGIFFPKLGHFSSIFEKGQGEAFLHMLNHALKRFLIDVFLIGTSFQKQWGWNLTINKSKLTLSWRKMLSYRNQSIDLLCKSIDWFLDNNGVRHERIKDILRLGTSMIDISCIFYLQ